MTQPLHSDTNEEIEALLKIPLLGGDIQELADGINSLIQQKVQEARIDELKIMTELLDKEFAYYNGGKPFSEATGSVGHAPRIKKVIDTRTNELKEGK